MEQEGNDCAVFRGKGENIGGSRIEGAKVCAKIRGILENCATPRPTPNHYPRS